MESISPKGVSSLIAKSKSKSIIHRISLTVFLTFVNSLESSLSAPKSASQTHRHSSISNDMRVHAGRIVSKYKKGWSKFPNQLVLLACQDANNVPAMPYQWSNFQPISPQTRRTVMDPMPLSSMVFPCLGGDTSWGSWVPMELANQLLSASLWGARNQT